MKMHQSEVVKSHWHVHLKPKGLCIEFDDKHQRTLGWHLPNYPSLFGAVQLPELTRWLKARRGKDKWTIRQAMEAGWTLEEMTPEELAALGVPMPGGGSTL